MARDAVGTRFVQSAKDLQRIASVWVRVGVRSGGRSWKRVVILRSGPSGMVQVTRLGHRDVLQNGKTCSRSTAEAIGTIAHISAQKAKKCAKMRCGGGGDESRKTRKFVINSLERLAFLGACIFSRAVGARGDK